MGLRTTEDLMNYSSTPRLTCLASKITASHPSGYRMLRGNTRVDFPPPETCHRFKAGQGLLLSLLGFVSSMVPEYDYVLLLTTSNG
jgi:hypothetical protein